MDENQILDEHHEFQLFITEEARAGLKTAASWSYFLAILGFVGIGFMALAGIAMIVMSGFMSDMMQQADSPFPFPFWMFSFFYLVLAGLYFFPVLYLFKFANLMKAALRDTDNRNLTESIINLGRHYKFLGIMVIVLIGLYVVMIFAFVGMAVTMGGNL